MLITDSEFKALIPPLAPEEYAQLEENLIADGCRDAIVTWLNEDDESVILDGHNRYEICTRLSILFKTKSLDFSDRNAAKIWIIKNQFGRRNLPTYVRGELALKLEPLLAAQAKASQKAAGEHGKEGGRGNKKETLRSMLTEGFEPKKKESTHVTRKELAKTAKVSEGTMHKIKTIAKKAPEAVKEKLRKGETTINRAYTSIKKEENEKKRTVAKVAAAKLKPPKSEYSCVVIDPPWPMEKIERECRPNQAGFDYPTMDEDELKDFKIPSGEDCFMFVWTTHRFLPMALRLIEHWGFAYMCTMVWHKSGGFQPIGWPQLNCEFALVAKKGKPKFVSTKKFPACFDGKRREHSRKPDEFYEIISRVAEGPRIDIFSREKRAGFDQFGNETEKFKTQPMSKIKLAALKMREYLRAVAAEEAEWAA